MCPYCSSSPTFVTQMRDVKSPTNEKHNFSHLHPQRSTQGMSMLFNLTQTHTLAVYAFLSQSYHICRKVVWQRCESYVNKGQVRVCKCGIEEGEKKSVCVCVRTRFKSKKQLA